MKKDRASAGMSRPWAKVGLALGMLVPLFYLGPELVHRLLHAARGGRGESALWGEPLFYMVLLALPLAAIGYLVGRAIDKFGE